MQAKSGDQLGLPKQNTDFKIQKKKLVFAQEAVLKAEQAHFSAWAKPELSSQDQASEKYPHA